MAAPFAVGGMASVHLGRLEGAVGFRRAVVIKRMLASAGNVEARAMLLDEARLASRVQHANVVQTLDVVEEGPELFIVLEYVHGESLDRLLERDTPCPPSLAAAVLAGALRGLHAAHEARGEDGQPLELVHRDFSPHNVLVGADGVPRVLDFGVARARGRLQGTRDGQLKGKLAYLSPEQVHGEASRRSDLFAAGIVLWEALTGRRLFDAPSEAEVLSKVLLCRVPPLENTSALQAVLDRALAREPEARFSTALEMAQALEALGVASTAEVANWVAARAEGALAQRTVALQALDQVTLPVAGAKDVVAAPAPASRRALTSVVVAVAALLAAGGVLWSTWPRAGGPSGDALPAATVGPVVAPSPPAPPADEAQPEPPPPSTAEPQAAPLKARPLPSKPGASSPTMRPEVERCNPPFTIDSNGDKQFKVECLK